MKAASINEIKSELKLIPAAQITELCLRLARYKKENKELLTYLLFEADDQQAYINNVKEEIDNGFSEINTSNIYFAKKSLRKILRITNKHIKYTGSKEVEVQLLLHYCTSFKGLKIATQKSATLSNLYSNQIKKIGAAISSMHEDLQHEYLRELDRLM
jgi:hypothetical protein